MFFSEYSLFIKVVLIFSLFFLLGLIFTYLSIAFVRWKAAKEQRFRAHYQTRFHTLFIEEVLLIEQDTPSSLANSVKKFSEFNLNNKRVRRALAEEIIQFRSQFLGTTADRFRELYLALNLQRDLEKSVKSRSIKKIVLAVKELIELEIRAPWFEVESFLRHKNQYVREICRRYVITTVEDGISKVFNSLNESLTGVEELEIFQSITTLKGLDIPEFSQWLKEENDFSLVSLCLKLVVYFQQYSAVPAIESLLFTENLTLRKEAVNALGKLMQPASEESLARIYDEQNEPVKIEIIKALGRICSGERLNLLQSIFLKERGIELRKRAVRAIMNHGEQGELLVSNLYMKAASDDRVIINHMANNLIKQ